LENGYKNITLYGFESKLGNKMSYYHKSDDELKYLIEHNHNYEREKEIIKTLNIKII
jgi:hypothetical protein